MSKAKKVVNPLETSAAAWYPADTVDVTVSASGKIPRRTYENFTPFFSVKEIYKTGLSDKARADRQDALFKQVNGLFNRIRDDIRLEEIQEQFKNLRFTLNPATGKKYPHVSDILYWDAEFYISPDELTQYGARGSAIHAMIDHWIKTKEWDQKVINKRDMILLKNGSLRLYDTLETINFLGFMEAHGKDIEFGEGEFRGFNEENFYCGQPDRVGKYQGVPAIFDWKCRAAKDDDFKQMAAYVKLDDPRLKDITRMVVVPLNPDNKSGYGKPVVSDEPDKYFNLFLRDRHDFRDKFGI